MADPGDIIDAGKTLLTNPGGAITGLAGAAGSAVVGPALQAAASLVTGPLANLALTVALAGAGLVLMLAGIWKLTTATETGRQAVGAAAKAAIA